DDEGVLPPDVLADLDLDFPVGEAAHLGLAQRALQGLADPPCEREGGVSSEDLEVARRRHGERRTVHLDHPRAMWKCGERAAAPRGATRHRVVPCSARTGRG